MGDDATRTLRETFWLMRACAAVVQNQNQGPAGPQGEQGPQGPRVRADDTDIDKLVCGEFDAFASVMQHEFLSVFTERPPNPFGPFGAAGAWTEWRPGCTAPLAALLPQDLYSGQGAIVARQTQPVTESIFVARTICSVGTLLYVATTVEGSDSSVHVLTIGTLSPTQPRSLHSAPVEQYLLDSTTRYASSGTEGVSPACALLSRLGSLGGDYVFPSKETATDISQRFADTFLVAVASTSDTTPDPSNLYIAVIGTMDHDGVVYALVVPYLAKEGNETVAYQGPYISTSNGKKAEHTGAAVLVIRGNIIIAVESPTGDPVFSIE